MDTALTTNVRGALLEFRNVTRFGDGSGFSTLLVVESGALAAQLPFSFEPHPLRTFLAALREMDRTVAGSAVLQPMWEPRFIRLDLDNRGHVAVSGEIGDYRQVMRFTFETDQTCLRPLANAIEVWFSLPTT